jgi:hypothetical protein
MYIEFLAQSTSTISRLISNNAIIPSKHTRTIIEQNNVEIPSIPLALSPKLSVKRLSMSQLNYVDTKQQQPISKEHSTTNNK